jgi:hypothetical protein
VPAFQDNDSTRAMPDSPAKRSTARRQARPGPGLILDASGRKQKTAFVESDLRAGLLTTGSNMAGRRRRDTSLRVENLEGRLSLSSFSKGASPAVLFPVFAPTTTAAVGKKTVPADLNPQPLPPGVAHVDPMVQSVHLRSNIIAII